MRRRRTYLSQLLGQFAQDDLLIEELALVAVLEVLRYPRPQLPRQLAVGHVLLHLLQL